MSNFTPQQIEEFLQEFFDVVGARQYVGARYVPIFGRAGEDTVEWDDGAPYEPLTVVMHEGVSYVSRRYVPKGIQITDTAYWVQTYRFNAQVEQYRQEVLGFQAQIDQVRDDCVPFPLSTVYPKYGEPGQVLSTLADGTTLWVDPVVPSDEQATEIITAWLDDHPEATTTVVDGSITNVKIADGTIRDSKLTPNHGVRAGLDYVSGLVTGQIPLTFRQGVFNQNGYVANNNYVCAEIPYVEGRSIRFQPLGEDGTSAFSCFRYVSDSAGVQVFAERFAGITITPTDTVVVNMRTNPSGPVDVSMGPRMVLVCDQPTLPDRLAAAVTDIQALQTLTSPLVASPITNSALVNGYLAELFLANVDTTKHYYVGSLFVTGTNDLRVVIKDDDDWVCWFQQPVAGIEAGKAYFLEPYRDNFEYGWFVLKSATIATGFTGTATVIDSVYRLNAWPIIQRSLVIADQAQAAAIADIEGRMPTKPLTGKTLVCLGDSIFGQIHTATGIPALLGDMTGATALNCALGGTRGGYRASGFWQYYDFPALSQAIATGDYTNQRAHTAETGVPSYFAGVIEDLAALDWTGVDYVTVCYGGNDYTGGETSIAQFVSDMAAGVNRIIQAHPSVRVLLVTPPYKFFMNDSHQWTGDGSTVTYNDLTLNDFVDAFASISEETFSPVCDLYTGLGINRYNTGLWFATNDGSHPSEDGRRMTARFVYPYLARM